VRPYSSFVPAAAGAIAAAFLLSAPPARLVAVAATPPPTPPPINQPQTQPPTPVPAASVIALPSATPLSAPPKTKPTPTPPPNARKGLDGVWEVQIQHTNNTDYTHFKLTQEGDAITGTYLDAAGKKYPLAGSVDGQAVRLIVTMPNGTTMLLEGRLDGTTDMVGELTTPSGQLPFTAAYRAKTKFIDNVNPSPGGIPGQSGGYTPP
jgi:hypothetical protein